LVKNWGKLVERVGRYAVGAKGALRDAQPVAINELQLTVGYSPEFEEEMDNLKSPRTRTALQHQLKSILQRDVSIVLTPVEGLEPLVFEATAPAETTLAYEIEGSSPDVVAESGGSGERTRAEWHLDPSVQKVLDAFNGIILDVR